MKLVSHTLLNVPAVVFMLVLPLSAETPHAISYQGRVTDGAGNPVNGTHSLTFAIYADSAGGTALWTETHTEVSISEGLFEVKLGSVTPLESSIFHDQSRWLGTRFDLGPELVPRTQIVAVAYAYRSEHADTASYAFQAGGGIGGWIDDGTVVRLATETDSVGIGTTHPEEKLQIEGDVRLGDHSSVSFGSNNSRLYSSTTDMILTADDDIHLQPDDDIYVRQDGDAAWVHFDNSAEKLGVGILDPQYKLTVQGEISIAVGGASKYHINYYNDGLNFAETGVQDRRLHIGDGGNVGIGTAEPGAKLGVNGDLKVNGAFRGDITSESGTDGAPYPRPAYNSGWIEKGLGSNTLIHNIGGDASDYVVDFKRKPYGDNFSFICDIVDLEYEMTNSQITIIQGAVGVFDSVRVRIWVVE